jgi:hypothetical protein
VSPALAQSELLLRHVHYIGMLLVFGEGGNSFAGFDNALAGLKGWLLRDENP